MLPQQLPPAWHGRLVLGGARGDEMPNQFLSTRGLNQGGIQLGMGCGGVFSRAGQLCGPPTGLLDSSKSFGGFFSALARLQESWDALEWVLGMVGKAAAAGFGLGWHQEVDESRNHRQALRIETRQSLPAGPMLQSERSSLPWRTDTWGAKKRLASGTATRVPQNIDLGLLPALVSFRFVSLYLFRIIRTAVVLVV